MARYVPYYGPPGPGTGLEDGPGGHTPMTGAWGDNAEAGILAAVRYWAPSVAYALGEQVVSPSNDVVTCAVAHTAGASYDASNWTLSSTYGRQGPKGWALDPVSGYGAKGDGKTVTDAVTTAASATLTSATAAFTAADVGKQCCVQGVGSGQLATPVLTLGATTGSGGFLPAGAQFWVVAAVNANGETIGSNEVTSTPGLNGTQALSWVAITGAAGYTVYRGIATGAENTAVAYLGPVITFLDRGISSNFAFTPQTTNTTAGTLSTTIAAYVSATQVTLASVATVALTGAQASYGTDDTAAIQAAINAATVASVILDDRLYARAASRGGGRMILPPGTYMTTAVLNLPPLFQLDAYGAALVANHTGVMVGYSTISGLFGPNGAKIRGLTVDGANLASVGIDVDIAQWVGVSDAVVYHCGTGVRLRGAQYGLYTNVTVRDCATVCWDLDVNGAGTNPAYDNTFVKCFAQGSPIGMSLGNAGGNAFYGCSVQSSRLYGGVGFLVKAAAVGNLISGSHLEYNGIHVDIQSGAKGTVIEGGIAVGSAERYIRNAGSGTEVRGLGGQHVAPLFALNSSYAPFEQNSAAGDLTVAGCTTVTSLFTDETGADKNPATQVTPTRVNATAADPRQNATNYFATAAYRGGTGTNGFTTGITGDSVPRLSLTADGGLTFSSGAAAPDASIARVGVATFGLTGNIRPDALNSRTVGVTGVPFQRYYFGPAGSAPFLSAGTGTPETVVTAPIGSLYTRYDGGAATTLYVKESGVGNTGWIAK